MVGLVKHRYFASEPAPRRPSDIGLIAITKLNSPISPRVIGTSSFSSSRRM